MVDLVSELNMRVIIITHGQFMHAIGSPALVGCFHYLSHQLPLFSFGQIPFSIHLYTISTNQDPASKIITDQYWEISNQTVIIHFQQTHLFFSTLCATCLSLSTKHACNARQNNLTNKSLYKAQQLYFHISRNSLLQLLFHSFFHNHLFSLTILSKF